MKIKKIRVRLIIWVILILGFAQIVFNWLSSSPNESGFAVSNIFKSILDSDKEVKHINPFFYNKNFFSLECVATFYSGFTLEIIEEKLFIEGKLLKNYENGDLFKCVVELPKLKGYFMNNNLCAVPSCLTEDRVTFYFFVTTDKIYRVSPYIYNKQKNQLYVGLNNEVLLIHLLCTDQEIIENSIVVCQSDAMHIVDEYGRISNIALENGKVEYGRREYNQSNGELSFHEEFVWEKDKGLVSYGSAYRVEADILYLNAIEQK